MQAAKAQREALGVELYGYQQQLTRLQAALAKTGREAAAKARQREAAEAHQAKLCQEHTASEQGLAKSRAQVCCLRCRPWIALAPAA